MAALSVCAASDTYTTVKTPPNLTTVKREVAPPSGDWTLYLNYTYGKNGELKTIASEFRTFNGYDPKTEEISSTKCERRYEVSEANQLVLKTELITDLKTKKVVQRTFWEPKVKHWMNISDLPKK